LALKGVNRGIEDSARSTVVVGMALLIQSTFALHWEEFLGVDWL